jgi:chromosomal replication initiation ATPase DnaA
MSNGKKDIELLLRNIQEGLRKYSVQELNEALNKILRKSRDYKPQIEVVLKVVCDEYNIPIIMLHKKNTRGIIQEAKQIACCLIHFNYKLSIRYIAENVFNSNYHTSVANAIKRYKTADIKHKQEGAFIEKYNTLKDKLFGSVENQKQIEYETIP